MEVQVLKLVDLNILDINYNFRHQIENHSAEDRYSGIEKRAGLENQGGVSIMSQIHAEEGFHHNFILGLLGNKRRSIDPKTALLYTFLWQ